MDCNELRQLATTIQLVTACDVVRNGMVRLATPFRYPDGSQIDLFLGERAHLIPYCLTDLGQTTAYLLDLQLKPWATQKRKQIIEDVCRSLDVDRDNSELIIRLNQEQLRDELPQAITRLAQACIRTADIAYTQRLRAPASFRDEVEEFITNTGVQVESGVVLPGRFEREVPVDFRTRGRHLRSLIITLSTQNTAAAHQVSTEAFRRWYDLEPRRNDYQFITLFDSTNDAFRQDDLSRLADWSTVFAFPAQGDAAIAAIAA